MNKRIKKIMGYLKLTTFQHNTHLQIIAGLVGILAVVTCLLGFLASFIVGVLVTLAVSLVIGMVMFNYKAMIEKSDAKMADLVYRIKRGEQEASVQMPIGILLFDQDHHIQWLNPYLQRYLGKQDVLGEPVAVLSSDLAELLAEDQKVMHTRITLFDDCSFEVTIQPNVGAMYLVDTTETAKIQQDLQDHQLILGQVFLDNYDEVTQTMDDQTLSNLSNYLTTQLGDWATAHQLFLKRIDDDHFFIVGYMKDLAAVEAEKFQILDVVRDETTAQNYPITLSIGIAYGSDNLAELFNITQSNLDLALGRGGDQVVVKAQNKPARFYGGKTNPMERRTRVRARMISQALQGIFAQVSDIYVMGHMQPDMDVIGAALGLHRVAQLNNKKCYLVLDKAKVHTDVQRLLGLLEGDPELSSGILTPDEALAQIGPDSLLVMVDNSKPSRMIDSRLYEKLAERTVIIDHHRRGEEFPENPMLTYIEPYASSTSELITEIFEYQPNTTNETLSKLEATALLAGITVDTHSFTLRTGTRTFEAASYLRSMRADMGLIQNLLKEDVGEYLQRNHLITSMVMVTDHIALAAGEDRQMYDPVIVAQAADAILQLADIEAAFVLGRRPDQKVGVSARSLGQVNVQLIMEKMGGGGHLSNAATQVADATVPEVKAQLVDLIQAEFGEAAPAEATSKN